MNMVVTGILTGSLNKEMFSAVVLMFVVSIFKTEYRAQLCVTSTHIEKNVKESREKANDTLSSGLRSLKHRWSQIRSRNRI